MCKAGAIRERGQRMTQTEFVSLTAEFHRAYYNSEVWERGRTTYFGVPIAKCPLDLWIYQELIFRVQPRVIIETGTWCGASAQFLANTVLMSHVQNPLIITIDIAPEVWDIKHMHVLQLVGSSTDSGVLARCRKEIDDRPDGPVMVILDSDHHENHVYAELELYAPMVTANSYLIVEDTNINGRPVNPAFGPGPGEALDRWLPSHPEFAVDLECEKFGLTFNPGGYLRKE